MTGMWAGGAILGSSIIGGIMSSNAANKAASAQQNAANQAATLSQAQFDKLQELYKPYRESGYGALGMLGEGVGEDVAQYQFDPSKVQQDPGYQFRVDAANKALARRQAATGNFGGGRAVREISGLNQGLASQEFSNAYGRDLQTFLTNQGLRTERMNQLMGIAQMGAGATGQTGNWGMTNASNISQNMLASGNAQAAAAIAQGNAWGNLASGVGTLGLMYGIKDKK